MPSKFSRNETTFQNLKLSSSVNNDENALPAGRSKPLTYPHYTGLMMLLRTGLK